MTDPRRIPNPVSQQPASGILSYETPQLPPRHGALLGWGIALTVLGALNLLLALGIFILPYGLFLLGGGGDVDAFDEFAGRFVIVAIVVLVVALTMLAGGIAMLVARRRKRRAASR